MKRLINTVFDRFLELGLPSCTKRCCRLGPTVVQRKLAFPEFKASTCHTTHKSTILHSEDQRLRRFLNRSHYSHSLSHKPCTAPYFDLRTVGLSPLLGPLEPLAHRHATTPHSTQATYDHDAAANTPPQPATGSADYERPLPVPGGCPGPPWSGASRVSCMGGVWACGAVALIR